MCFVCSTPAVDLKVNVTRLKSYCKSGLFRVRIRTNSTNGKLNKNHNCKSTSNLFATNNFNVLQK